MTVRIHSPHLLPEGALRGRACATNPDARFLQWQRERDTTAGEDDTPTRLTAEQARTVISYNSSPDLPFDRSVNPYRGCEHGCIYCYARPSHARLDLSPGLDFETRLLFKPEAAALLRTELGRRGYRCAPLALGTNTDAWQPAERHLGITRAILAVLLECGHPVSIVTKSSLIERDLDLLGELAARQLAEVTVSITTLDDALARRLEPRAPRPARRLDTLAALRQAGVPAGVFVAPLIPALNDHELEAIVEAASNAGAAWATHILLRLPGEVEALFRDWLARHYPDRARHVLGLLAQCRDGALNDARFGHRMRGSGTLATLYSRRMALLRRRHGLHEQPPGALRTDLFRPPRPPSPQGELF